MLLEPESEGIEPASLVEALQAGGIHYRLSGTDPSSCLRSVVEVLSLPEAVDREFLYQVLWARESLDSTAVGGGVAVPHLRNPIVLHLQRPLLAICFLEAPVDFGALDGQPVHTLLPVVTLSVKTHLQLLSQLSFALRDPEFKGLIDCQAPRNELQEGMRRISDKVGRAGGKR